MQKVSIKSFVFSFAIILAIISFWFMQMQVLTQKKTEVYSVIQPANKISAGEQAKQLFTSNINTASNINLVGIIHNIRDINKSYIILNIEGKNSIYRSGQEVPNLGKLIAINKQDIDFESKQGPVQKLFISSNTANDSSLSKQNNDANYADYTNTSSNGILPQPNIANLPEPIIYGQDPNNLNNPNSINNNNTNQGMDNYAVPYNNINQNNNQNIGEGVIQTPIIQPANIQEIQQNNN